MIKAITVSNSDRPAYRILDPYGFFGPDDNLYPEGAEIFFDGEPNENMEPLNEAAVQRLHQYIEKQDNLARENAKKLGRPFTERPRSLEGGLELATQFERERIRIMGAERDTSQIEKVDQGATPDTSAVKRGRGRPAKNKTVEAA